jgi:type IV secretory pathway TrbD component
LRANPAIQRSPNIRRDLIAPVAFTFVLLATPALSQGPVKASDVGDWIVALFGLLLWTSCLLSLFALGMRAMSSSRYKRAKHKRRRQAKQHA